MEIQGAWSMATDLDVAAIQTKRLHRIDYRELDSLQISADKDEDPKMVLLELFNVVRLYIL
jgi:hypothetical protein